MPSVRSSASVRSSMALRVGLAFTVIVLGVLAAATSASAARNTMITNSVHPQEGLSLMVDTPGHIRTSTSAGEGGDPASASGIPNLNLRDKATNEEMFGSTLREEWGVRFTQGGTRYDCQGGRPPACSAPLIRTVSPERFEPTGCLVPSCTTAITAARMGPIEVSHVWRPSSELRAYEAAINVRNVGAAAVSAIEFVRVARPHLPDGTPFVPGNDGPAGPNAGWGTTMSVGAELPATPALLWSSNHYQWNPNFPYRIDPVVGPNPVTLGPGVLTGGLPFRTGPLFAQGAYLLLDLQDLEPGESRPFNMYYGAADDLADAQATIARLGLQVWAIAEPPPATQEGLERPTFFFGFNGLPAPATFDLLDTSICHGTIANVVDTTLPALGAVPVTSTWDWGDGTTTVIGDDEPWMASAQHTYPDPAAARSIRLTFEDSQGWITTTAVAQIVEVRDCTPPPTAVLDAVAPVVDDCAPSTVRVNRLDETLPGGPLHPLVTWKLEFAGQVRQGAWPTSPLSASHDFVLTAPGTFQATLTVTDDRGLNAVATDWVTVCPNRAPSIEPAAPPPNRLVFGTPLVLALSFEDPDLDDLLDIQVTTAGGAGSFGLPALVAGSPETAPAATGLLTWLPPSDGLQTLQVTATDAAGLRATYDLAVHVSMPYVPPTPVADSDADGVADSVDNCTVFANDDQGDRDSNGRGDACEPTVAVAGPAVPGVAPHDVDRDGVQDGMDNCVRVANALQTDLDGDGLGDACDVDADGDAVLDAGADNCLAMHNPDQADRDRDGHGDACVPPAVTLAPIVNDQIPPAARARSPMTDSTHPMLATLLVFAVTLLPLRRAIPTLVVAFSRLRRSDLLQHPIRSAVADLVASRPGIRAQEIERQLGLGHGTLQHHLRVLVKAGLVAVASAARQSAYFPVGARLPEVSLEARVARAVAAQPGCTMAALARAAGASPGAVRVHVRRMAERGDIFVQRQGTRVRIMPSGPSPQGLGERASATRTA